MGRDPGIQDPGIENPTLNYIVLCFSSVSIVSGQLLLGWHLVFLLIFLSRTSKAVTPLHFVLSLSLSGACHEDVAASTSRRRAGLSIARRLAVARPKLSGRRSSSTVLSQVCLGLPVFCRQSLGGPRMQARRAREWS